MNHEANGDDYPGGARSGLWDDVVEIPSALSVTLEERQGFAAAASLIKQRCPNRLVVSGNGAAYYVAHALWLASLATPGSSSEVLAVPSGLLARGRFVWRPGDLLIAVSSSGEFRDLVEALDGGAPRPYVAVTSSPESTVGRGAEVVAGFRVLHQRALTHSQVVCGGIATILSIWAMVTGDSILQRTVDELPGLTHSMLKDVVRWEAEVRASLKIFPRSAVTCSTGAGWTAALEAALLLKEVARLPTEGGETREAATSGMYALREGDMAFLLPTRLEDPLLSEAGRIFERAGATLLCAPTSQDALDERVAGVALFPASAALALTLARLGGADPDRPSWATTYYETAR